MGKAHTTIFIPNEDAELLRGLAVSLDLHIKKGPGTGEIGSIRAVVLELAKQFGRKPEQTTEAIRGLMDTDHADAP